MNPEFGFGYPQPLQPQVPGMGPGNLPPSPSVDAVQSSSVLTVSKLQGGTYPPAPAPMHVGIGSMSQAPAAGGIGASSSMGWNIAQAYTPTIPHAMTPPHPTSATPYMSAGLPLSQYSVRNQQNVEIARAEPLGQGYVMKGSAGDIILGFALEMTQSSNTPIVLIRSPGTGVVIASLTTELKQSKEDKHKDKPKKDKKKDKDDHKDKSKDKGSKRQYVLRNHMAQPMLRLSGKQKAKDIGRFEFKIKSVAEKDDGGGEVESLGSSSGVEGFQIKFKLSHKHQHGSSHGHGSDPYSGYQKCFILAGVIGIIELFQPAQL